MAGNKATIQKTGVKEDLAIAANLRTCNLCHDAEIEMIIAVGEALGLKMRFNKKTGETSIDKEQTSLSYKIPETSPQILCQSINSSDEIPLNNAAIPASEAERLEAYKDAIRELIKESPIEVTAHCDSSVLMANNDAIMILVEKKWNDWFRTIKTNMNTLIMPQQPKKNEQAQKVFQYGGDVCYKINEPDEHSRAPAFSADYVKKEPSKFKRFISHLYEDAISSWWKYGAYTLCFCSLCLCISLWYKNYRMECIVKEYDIIKPVLMSHPFYRSFIQSLDSTLTTTDIDDVIERIQKNQYK